MPAPQMTPKAKKAYDEALRRIEECRKKGKQGTFHRLSELGLTILPPEIGQFTAMTKLYLHGNPGLGLPAEVLGPEWNEVNARKPAAKPQAILDVYFKRQPSRAASSKPVPSISAAPRQVPSLPVAASEAADPSRYDVFICVKSADNAHARKAAHFLRKAGLRIFFSEQELPEMGNSEYFDAIFTALEGARHMLVVTTSRAHADSKWVKKEWQAFLNEKLSDRKQGNLVALLCDQMKIADLPLSLRQHEARCADDLPDLLHYFKARGS